MKIFYLALLLPSVVFGHHPITESEKICQTKNLYMEARGEPLDGMLMVLDVVDNRSHSKHYPHNLCKVVYQPSQFSWTIDKKHKITKWKTYHQLKKLVDEYYKIQRVINLDMMWYHNNTVNPKWSRKSTQYEMQGNHKFYRKL